MESSYGAMQINIHNWNTHFSTLALTQTDTDTDTQFLLGIISKLTPERTVPRRRKGQTYIRWLKFMLQWLLRCLQNVIIIASTLVRVCVCMCVHALKVLHYCTNEGGARYVRLWWAVNHTLSTYRYSWGHSVLTLGKALPRAVFRWFRARTFGWCCSQ